MSAMTKLFGLTVFGLVAVLASAAPAQAQIPYNPFDPYGFSRRAAFNISLYGQAMRQVPPYALGYNPYPRVFAPGAVIPRVPPVIPNVGVGYPAVGGTLVNNPYATNPVYNSYTSSGYSSLATDPYGYGGNFVPYIDPYGGFFRGVADIISAEGRFRINNNQAAVIREQARQAQIDTKRRAFDEWLYERAHMPSMQDLREQYAKLDLRYHVNSAASTDILSASSLNTLLDQLRQMQNRGMRGPTIQLDEESLKQINVSSGSGGNVGLLKNEGRLTWPLALGGTEFENERKNLERHLPLAISEVEKHGQVDRGRLKDLMNDVEKMNDRLGREISMMTPSQYIEAKRYLALLSDALRALQTPDASNYFTGKYAARGKTVGDLVKNMGGLRFAPATPGEERAYRELYNALVAYYTGAQGSSTATVKE